MSERRKQEMEAKRAKIAEMRRAREERQRLLAQAESGGTAAPLVSSRKDINELVDSLLSPVRPPSPYSGPSRGASIAASIGGSGLTSVAMSAAPSAGVSAMASPASVAADAFPGRATPPISTSAPGTPGGRASRLSNEGSSLARGESPVPAPVVQVEYVDQYTEMYDMPSKIVKPETYSKAVQTTMVSTAAGPDDSSGDEFSGSRRNAAGRETEDEMRARIVAELDEERRVLEKELKELKDKTDNLQLQHLPDEQRQAIFGAADFTTFIEGSSRIVQRALSDGYDYIKDYTIGGDTAYDANEGQKVKLVCAFSDERWTNGRSVTDLDWSSKFPELSVASYNRNPSAPNDPDGIVAVWNLHLLERPEFVFHSPSDILSVTFSPFHPTLIFGGSYSGQVLLWDTRAKHLPVLKTPLSASGHTYPIYSMKMVGTQNANNLITSSTDGLVCSWQADMLSQPQEALLLSVPSPHNKTDEVSIACLDFAENETATFWVGTEEGSVYQANRYDRASAKAGLNPEDVYRGHAGPVTGIHFHPTSGSIDFSDLFLTSSVDWTVKLWRAKAGAAVGVKASAAAAGVTPVHSFEGADDYVFDVAWHPKHPALFGAVDGTGKFDLWDLNADVEVPLVSTQVSPRALNKLAWEKGPNPRKVGLGGSDGTLYVYDVADKVVTPRENEWVEMQKTVQNLAAQSGTGTGMPVSQDAARYR